MSIVDRVKGKVEDLTPRVSECAIVVRPLPLIADEIGLIVADAYGGEILRHPPRRPLPAARRKSLLSTPAQPSLIQAFASLKPTQLPSG